MPPRKDASKNAAKPSAASKPTSAATNSQPPVHAYDTRATRRISPSASSGLSLVHSASNSRVSVPATGVPIPLSMEQQAWSMV